MQPSMDVCAWIHQAQDRSWRQYVMCTPDAAMRTSLSHVYYPWQVFQRWRLQSPEGPLHQGSATPRCPEHQVFPRPAATVSQARHGVGATAFVVAQPTGTSPERIKDCCCHYHFKTSFKPDGSVGAGGGLADPARTSTEGAAPTTPPGGVIDRMRQGSIAGSVGPVSSLGFIAAVTLTAGPRSFGGAGL